MVIKDQNGVCWGLQSGVGICSLLLTSIGKAHGAYETSALVLEGLDIGVMCMYVFIYIYTHTCTFIQLLHTDGYMNHGQIRSAALSKEHGKSLSGAGPAGVL